MSRVPRRIFVAWLGDAPLSPARMRSLSAFADLSVPVVHIGDEDVDSWIVPEDPLPEGFNYLTATQKGDVLRCYLMHHHGGGYADIKSPGGEWSPVFDQLDAGPSLGAGYPEYWWGVANLATRHLQICSPRWWRYRSMQLRYRSLIGNCAFIFKPKTEFTRQWLDLTKARLESLTPALRRRPARGPRERAGEIVDGVACDYPVTWTALGGDIFHPLVLKYRSQFIRSLPRPRIDDYL